MPLSSEDCSEKMTRNMRCIILLSVIYGILSAPVEDEQNDFLHEFVSGNHRFTSTVYKEILKTATDNFICSPLSVEMILALTNEGAKGNTSEELVTGLSLPNTKQKIQKALKSIQPDFKKSDDQVKLLSANKIYAADDLKLEEDFKSVATTVYDAEVDNIDFSQSDEAAATINYWVENNTNHKIQNLISPEAIDNDTRIILVNALYFSGKWKSEFKTYETAYRNFFQSENETVEVETMYQVGHFNYYENPTLDAKFLELPYRGDDISMVIVLPNKKDGLPKLEQNIEQLLEPQPYTKDWTRVYLPKFTTESQIPLVPILKQLGVKKIFDDGDLTGLSSTDKDLVVSDVIQKAFVNVTESGTEAAAATAVIISLRIGGGDFYDVKYEFDADHPFLYFIKFKELVLFIGHYVNGTS